MTFSRRPRAWLAFFAGLAFALSVPSVASAAGPEEWVARYDGIGNIQEHNDEASSVATSPDGTTVFVTGKSDGPTTAYPDYATVAYDAGTGTQLWAKRYSPTTAGYDAASAVTVAPDGASVFVTGTSDQPGYSFDYFTIAYDASTGTRLWSKRYDGGAMYDDVASDVVASPDGSAVFVTGVSRLGPSSEQADYATIAYDAANGTKLWVKRYDGPHHNADEAIDAELSPDGSAVFVTGRSKGSPDFDYVTAAYRATSGQRIWVARYDGPRSGADYARALAVSPDGARVVVTGMSVGATTGRDYATVSYNASTGHQQWVSRYTGPNQATDRAKSIAISGDSSTVFVAGEKAGGAAHLNYGTVAYDAAAGTKLWAKKYNGTGDYVDGAIGVVAAGSLAVVTGYSTTLSFGLDYVTIAYDGATGATHWNYAYDGLAGGGNFARDIAASPDGAHVFVSGTSAATDGDDYATVAYAT
jgi:WD40 repeat protein